MGASGGAELPHPHINGGTGASIAIAVVLITAVGLATLGSRVIKKQIRPQRQLANGGSPVMSGNKSDTRVASSASNGEHTWYDCEKNQQQEAIEMA